VDPEYCVLVGFGPIGRIVHDILTRRGEKACVVDLNHETVRQLRGNGHMAVYGDVMRAGTLEEAGTARAATLVISSRVEDAAEVVRHARAINPAIRVLVRCEHLRDVPPIREAGADYVVSGEAEVGVSLARHIHEDRRRGGVEQAETWSEKTRRELYGE
jgi:CPA2 family monovalent cation:H+ antiporter-2